MMHRSAFLQLLHISLLLFILVQSAGAQSLIVGIPNAEVTEKGHFALTHESQTNFWEGQAKWNSFNFLTYGIGHDTEVALSNFNLAHPASGNVSLGIGFKTVKQLWRQTQAEREIKVTFGQLVLFSLERPDIGGWVYSHLSTRLPGLRTRLTGGISYGSSQLFGFRYPDGADGIARAANLPVCFIGGIEQPLNKRWSVVADWYSGQHELAALIPALQYNIGKSALILGYKFPNHRGENSRALITEVMIHF